VITIDVIRSIPANRHRSRYPASLGVARRYRFDGHKIRCGIALCGACTVHINGAAMRSCSVPIGALDGAKWSPSKASPRTTTIRLQRAWIEEGVPQCGTASPGRSWP